MNLFVKYCLFIILSFFISCKNDQIQQESKTQQRIERFFTKEGTLELKNDQKTIQLLDIEFAESDYETSEGLKHRYSMKENQGMLFLFPKAELKNFWMQDTRIPLDILYVTEDSVVLNIVKNAPPMTEYGIQGSTGPVQYVLEINGGMSDKWGIIEGKTKLSWKKE
ncbi:MAG: DUF192 domain-containing protein [Flavobacteriales bacterium]